jgi:Ca2+-binding RTX toxin-like protein
MTLNASATPGSNFDLDDWKLQLPVDADGGFLGRYTEVKVLDTYTSDYFFTGSDGAMVLRAPVEGVTTGGSNYARSELRELIGTANAAWDLNQGGYLTVAMQVDEVPTKFDGTEAKVVIGQIHGGDHQLVRLYWDHGTVYWVNGRNEVQARDAIYEFKDANGNTPKVDLNETFTYTMDVKGHDLSLSLVADGKTYTSSIAIGGGWDDNLFYFKAGLYLGSNETTSTGDGQISIFGLDVTHDGTKPVLNVPGTAPVVTPVVISDNGLVTTLQGSAGDDVFSVSQKSTIVNAGLGIDTVQSSVTWLMSAGVEKLVLTGTAAINGTGTTLNDSILGNEAANILKGNAGDDLLNGSGGADTLKGGSGADKLEGGVGADQLFGDSGADTLQGGAGDDRLMGGSDADVLTGGDGADTFVFSSVSQCRTGQADVITDFVLGVDHLDLSAIDANTRMDGNQAFVWGGTGIGHLAMVSGHLVADVNGDGKMDLDLQLGGRAVSALDLFL